MSITRTLAAALAIAALAAPTAAAYDIHAPLARAAAKAQKHEDLRSPDAKVGAYTPGATPAVSYTSRAPAAPATRRLPGPPTWPANPQPITPAKVTDGDNGIDWTTIGLGIAGSLLAVGGLAAFTTRHSRRTRHLRTTA
jgi:hypothetical protein